jgi:hypothetical protein
VAVLIVVTSCMAATPAISSAEAWGCRAPICY